MGWAQRLKESFINLYIAPFRKPPQHSDHIDYRRIIHLPSEGMTVTDTRIELGDRVQDMVSGFEGIATSKTEYLNGCVQFGIEPKVKDDGSLTTYNIDQQQLKVIEKRAVEPILPIGTLVSGERVEPAAGGPTRPAPRQGVQR